MATAKKISAAELQARNTRFWALDRAERRVEVAKDALKQIAAHKFKPTKGIYVKDTSRYATIASSENLQEALEQPGAKCACCAKGALFLSAARCGDRLSYESFNLQIIEGLQDIFSSEQLNLIEDVFERYHRHPRFDKKHETPTQRLTAILKNIIRNKGDFVEPSRTW